jgi:hypothetical protein
METEREPGERVLQSCLPLAMKLMAALNERLIAALRRRGWRFWAGPSHGPTGGSQWIYGARPHS